MCPCPCFANLFFASCLPSSILLLSIVGCIWLASLASFGRSDAADWILDGCRPVAVGLHAETSEGSAPYILRVNSLSVCLPVAPLDGIRIVRVRSACLVKVTVLMQTFL